MENGFGLGGFGSGIWVLGFGTHFLVFTKFFKTFPNFLLIIFNPFSNFHFFVFVPTFPSPLRKDPQLQPRPPQPQKESVKVQRLCIIGCMDTFAQYFLASYFLFWNFTNLLSMILYLYCFSGNFEIERLSEVDQCHTITGGMVSSRATFILHVEKIKSIKKNRECQNNSK
jgi:hypothetical protein